MEELSAKIEEFCNPFRDDAPTSLVNIATGKVASQATESYLFHVLERGRDERHKFQEEWITNSSRFLEPVKRTRVQNFAAQNVKKNVTATQKAKFNAESLRDVCTNARSHIGEDQIRP